jgi:glucokinase
MKRALGIDLGGTQIKAVVVTSHGEIIERRRRATMEGGEIGGFAAGIRCLVEELGEGMPVGISAPGIAAKNRRSIACLPGRLEGLEGLDWTSYLGCREEVMVTNDANCALMAEAWMGAARGMRNVIMLTLGTGVGGSILNDGRLLLGHSGKGGHLGHICLDPNGRSGITGMPGALEVFCGNYNIAERTEGRFETTHELISAYLGGDAEASRWWLTSVRALACAVASFGNVLDPEAVIIGGGIAQAGTALFGPLKKEMDKIEWRPRGQGMKIIAAALGDMAGAIGAARIAMVGTDERLALASLNEL